jgi:hypothetical protein
LTALALLHHTHHGARRQSVCLPWGAGGMSAW